MSLNAFQRDRARFHGGKEIKAHKAHLARTATAIRKLRNDATTMGGQLDGVFDADEMQTIRSTCELVDRAIARLEADAREADHIKKAFDDHEARAAKALSLLPLNDFEGVIAIAELAGDLAPGVRMYTPLESARRDGYRSTQRDLLLYAVKYLAADCAIRGHDVATYVETVRSKMPAAAAKHTDLIRELNTLAVSEQLEKHI